MKKLMLVRHAKSDWDNPDLTDFERPLNKRGEKDAPVMAERVITKRIIPQYIISSPAERAKTTANIFAKAFKLAQPEYNKNIYEAGYKILFSIVTDLSDEYDFAALFGHNPGISQLLYYLTDKLYDMPTCAVAIISFDVTSWQLVSGSTGIVEYYDYPKNDD